MLISEILNESQDGLVDALEEIITRAKADSKQILTTNIVISKLRSAGYTVDDTSLVDLLNNIKSVNLVDGDEITLDTPDSGQLDKMDDDESHKDDNDKKVVKDLAKKQTKKKKL